MAFDLLQVPATIINNDKLVSMAGNLMAKEKADQDKREAGFINQMAKIDSSNLRQGDVNIFKEKYNDLINYGSKADLQSIEGQTEVARKLNELNAFVNISKAAKEQYDVPLLKRRFEKDFDPKSSAYIDEIIATPTSKLAGIDFNRLKSIDDKDYELDIKKGFANKSVVEEIGNVTYKNTPNLMPKIVAAADNYINAIANTETGRKAIQKFISRNEEYLKDKTKNLSETEKIQEINKAYRDDLVGYFIGVADQSKTTGTNKKETYFDQLGIKPYQVASAIERGALLKRMYDGDEAAWDMYTKLLPEGSTVQHFVNADVITKAAYDVNGKRTPASDEIIRLPKRDKFFDYAFNANGILEAAGSKRGYADINYEILKPVMEKTFENISRPADFSSYAPKISKKDIPASNAPILGEYKFKTTK